MVLKTVGVAGTLESSDAMITVDPANQGGIVIDVSSSVKRQFGRQIEETVLNTIKELGVENANVKVVDKAFSAILDQYATGSGASSSSSSSSSK